MTLPRGLRSQVASHPFRAPWWLRGPHLQTCYSPLFRRRPRVSFQLEELATPDGDFLRLHRAGSGDGEAAALLLHGLEGSVRSNYVQGQARGFLERGWDVAALEFRSCGGRLNRAPRFYHSGETGDLDWVVRRLVGERPGRKLFLSGVSLGANVIAKWLGELGEEVPAEVAGAAAISPPFDLAQSGPVLDRALGGLYVRRFLRTLVPKALAKEKLYPGLFDTARLRRASSFAEFDTHVTAALHGFRHALDYWRRCGCGQYLGGVRRPLLLLAARDDPFNPAAAVPVAEIASNPWLLLQLAERGGHVGFVYGRPGRTHHWAEEQVLRFFVGLAEG